MLFQGCQSAVPRAEAGEGSIQAFSAWYWTLPRGGPMCDKGAGKFNAWATTAKEFSSDAGGESARPSTFYGKPRSAALQAFRPIVRFIQGSPAQRR